MKALIQRVEWSRVCVDGEVVSAIGPGMLVFIGVGRTDAEKEAAYLARKTAALRIFEDPAGKMNLSLVDTGGEALVVPQFTLMADSRSGNRPGFGSAAPPAEARGLYEMYVEKLRSEDIPVQTGVFGADMTVSLANVGPVTILLES